MSTTLPLEPIEKVSRDELQALQLERLKKTLAHAYAHSPVYPRKFDEAGIHPDDFKTLSDLSRFPFTTKQDFRNNYPFGMFAVPMDQISRIHSSSGTTGKPIVVGYTANDIDMWASLVARSIRAAGTRRGDKVHVSYGYGLFTGGLGAHYGAERAGIEAVDIYGLSEIIGPGVASEYVETKDGLTIWEDHFYPEIIDPGRGEVLPEGVFGELVFTSLTKEALPIIRYRTRDLTRLLPSIARTMRRMEKITGRSDDMMIIHGVNVFPSQIEELLLKHAVLAPYYQIVLTKEGPLDVMTIHVEPCPESAPDERAVEAARASLAHDVKARGRRHRANRRIAGEQHRALGRQSAPGRRHAPRVS
ncbi:hypothetical protein DFQ28_011534 [Apophysomyces sp. BC1034]|nr:hypothetical protein DFQ30_001573 [Apophysomyces sp. BC1015]KAG0184235.1 hypothetical protein DFQ28_011534 [Apophysomyces sp. BC1034]